MTTILRQRSNLATNPRGQDGAGITGTLEERRRNLVPNPRYVNPGSAGVVGYTLPTAYNAGTAGTLAHSWQTADPYTGSSANAGITTGRVLSASNLGGAAADRAGEYVEVAATPGQRHTASVYVGALTSTTPKAARIVVEYRSATAALATTLGAPLTLPGGGNTIGRRISATATAPAPAGTTLVRVYVWLEGTGNGVAASATAPYTALLLEESTVVGSYFDGSGGTVAEGDATSWAPFQGANTSPSSYLSLYVEAYDLDGKLRRCLTPVTWDVDTTLPLSARASFYRWNTDTDPAVRIHPPAGGNTTGPLVQVDDGVLWDRPASVPATLLVEARRERPGSAVQLAPVVNGAALPAQAVGDEWAVYRFPVTITGGTGVDNLLRLGKTGADPLLVRAVALVDEANYAGPYFDGNTPTVGVLDSQWTDTREAPYSSSFQGVPSLSLTAAAEPDAWPPRVRVDVVDADPDDPARELLVERVDSSGRRTPVRSRTGGLVELAEAATGRSVVLYDHEAPLGQAVNYTVTVDAAVPFIPSGRVTVDSDRPWLVHPGVPARSRPLSIAKLGTRRRRVVEGVYDVVGRGDPIVRTDGKRKSPTSELVLRTYTDAEREGLDLLLDDATVLLLNIPPARRYGVTYEWVSIGDSDEERTADAGTWPRRLWPLPYRVVGRPIGGTRSARTWHDVAKEAASWAELARQHDSWADVADPTNTAG